MECVVHGLLSSNSGALRTAGFVSSEAGFEAAKIAKAASGHTSGDDAGDCISGDEDEVAVTLASFETPNTSKVMHKAS